MTSPNNYDKTKHRILITLGDPAGIGTEIILKALGSGDLPKNMHPLLIGCKRNIENVYAKLLAQGTTKLANPKNLDIEDIPATENFIFGKPNAQTGKASFDWLTYGTQLLLEGKAKALVTAPIAKYIWHQAGYFYPGQTERLAELAKVKNPSMLFTAISPNNGWRLNTLLATTHIPFASVPEKLTAELITFKLNVLLNFCQKFTKHPKLAICGLNPHAGEDGKLGLEEIHWLIPVIKEWQKNHPEIELKGPVSPDTCWISAAKRWQSKEHENSPDGFLALYHDQGLIPMKLISFESAVNTTLGLPFTRTSPDHGTGFDIAGKGIARPNSMLAAIKTAWELSN